MGVLNPLFNAVSWVLLRFHDLFSLVMNPDSGWTWALSIVGLVVLIRILLIPLFVKQIKAQRGLQALQPKMKEIQKKHANDREKQSQELMKLYKDTGTNPLASCFPILIQAPFFFSLFHVLSYVAKDKPVGVITDPHTISSFANATIFGAKISSTFLNAPNVATKVVTIVLILLMTATTFITQRQLMLKNMPAGQDNPMAQQQKILLYVFPLMFAVFGINFPIGVLIYWLTTNLWTMGQQFWVIHRNPTPGSPAYDDMLKRRAEKEAHKKAAEARRNVVSGDGASEGAGDSGVQTVVNDVPAAPQRQQPKRQPKSKRGGTPKR